MDSGDSSLHKKHKKHKRDRDGYGGSPPPSSLGLTAASPGIKMILKLGGGGSSTPERSDSPGMLNVPQYEGDDSQHSSLFAQHVKKAKKKDKKRKKDKKHKHHHKEKKRRREEMMAAAATTTGGGGEEVSMDADSSRSNTFMKVESDQSSSMMVMDTMTTEDNSDLLAAPPAVKESKAPPPKTPKFIDKQPFQKLLDYLVRTLEKKDIQQFFAWPVTDSIAPGYSSIIKKPMDFSTMKSKIENETYNSLSELTEDFKLMCNNAMTYNAPETIYYKAAKRLLQGGIKILSPEKIKSMLPLIPSIRFLTEEHLGSPLFGEQPHDGAGDALLQSEDDSYLDLVCLDPTKSVHYVPPHPNDPPDICGAFTDDLTTEEVLLQARLAAREAAHKLSTKKPNSKMGFCRQKPDGSTSLAILTPCSGVLPGTKEMPISLGALSGKLTHGTAQVQMFKEDKRNLVKMAKPLSYGSFSSFAPSHDSTFSNLTSEESELLTTTYGDETAIQYAESMHEFAKGCDFALHIVDEILDTITKGEHRKTVNLIEERKRVEAEESRLKGEQEELTTQLEMEWQSATATTTADVVNMDALKSLEDDIGIDTKFLEYFSQGNSVVEVKLQETAQLIGDLQRVQNERLSQPPMPYPPYAPQATDAEVGLATRITENLTEMAKQITPGDLVAAETIRKVMGIDIGGANYNPAGSSSIGITNNGSDLC